MDFIKSFFSSSFVFLFHFFPSPSMAMAKNNCSYSKCNSMIKFPFRTSDQPIPCGLPGFDLLCNDHTPSKPLLQIPSRHQHGPKTITLTVESISYPSQALKLTDPYSCLPGKLLILDDYLSSTPFYLANYSLFSVYNCSSRALYSSSYTKIDCLSGPNHSVVCGRDNMGYPSYKECELIGNVGGTGTNPGEFSGATSVLLRWVLPELCVRCQGIGGECRRHAYVNGKVTCSKPIPPPSSSNSRDTDHVRKIVIPILIFLGMMFLATSIIVRNKRDRARRTTGDFITMELSRLNTASASNTNRQPPGPPNTVPGLEQGTLDAYPTTVVGESGRMLAHMEDKSCSICLSDYTPKETLKTLPECLHKFHVGCIDEWLRTKALCPVCRTPPPRRSS